MDITFEPVIVAQELVQPHRGYDIGHHPVVRIEPAFADHALGREVHHMGRTFGHEQRLQRLCIGLVGGTLAELVAHFTAKEPRGEFVVVVAGAA